MRIVDKEYFQFPCQGNQLDVELLRPPTGCAA